MLFLPPFCPSPSYAVLCLTQSVTMRAFGWLPIGYTTTDSPCMFWLYWGIPQMLGILYLHLGFKPLLWAPRSLCATLHFRNLKPVTSLCLWSCHSQCTSRNSISYIESICFNIHTYIGGFIGTLYTPGLYSHLLSPSMNFTPVLCFSNCWLISNTSSCNLNYICICHNH